MKLRLKKQAESKTIFAYGFGRNAKDNRPKAYEGAWRDLVAHMMEATDADLYPSFTGSETKEQYAAKKTSLPYISAEFDGRRSNDGVLGRAFMFLDVDGVRRSVLRSIKAELRSRNLTYFFYTTTGDRHDLKDGLRCARFILPTDRVMAADEIYRAQCKFAYELGLWGAEGVDATAYERARIMFCPAPGAEVEQFDGRPVSVRRTLRNEFEPDSERGAGTVWTEEALANADDNSRAIADWCFEEGLEALPSGRGWAVECPNYGSHSDHDALDGSTAIMMPDQRNAEVRFACRHDHCRELNRHQHLALRLVGVPDAYLPEAHNISRAAIAELLPGVDADEVYEAEIAAVGATNTCTDDDLDDDLEAKSPFAPGAPLIDGIHTFGSTFELVGASNIGKSFDMLTRMACVSTGIDYVGRPAERAHCFYFDAEGGASTAVRVAALRQAFADPLEMLHVIDITAKGWDIFDEGDRKKMVKLMADTAGDEGVGLVAFDSLNQTAALRKGRPFDENSAADMGGFASAMKAIAATLNACVGVVHHPAKGGEKRTSRGSGALHGAVDASFYLERPNEGDNFKLNVYHEKNRNGAKLPAYGIQLMQIEVASIPRIAPKANRPFTMPGVNCTPTMTLTPPANNETLFMLPVCYAPWPESAAGEQAKKSVVASKSSTEDIVLAAIQSLPDCAEGFTRHQILQATGMPSLPLNKALRKLEDAGTIVRGRDAEGDREYTFREPTGINDRKPFAHKATDDDLA